MGEGADKTVSCSSLYGREQCALVLGLQMSRPIDQTDALEYSSQTFLPRKVFQLMFNTEEFWLGSHRRHKPRPPGWRSFYTVKQSSCSESPTLPWIGLRWIFESLIHLIKTVNTDFVFPCEKGDVTECQNLTTWKWDLRRGGICGLHTK